LEDSGKATRRDRFSRMGSRFDQSIKDFDVDGKNQKDNLDEVAKMQKEMDEELLDYDEDEEDYDEESDDGGEFILEPVNPKDSK